MPVSMSTMSMSMPVYFMCMHVFTKPRDEEGVQGEGGGEEG